MSLQELIELLQSILSEKDVKAKENFISKFQNYIWNTRKLIGDENIDDVLVSLAHDLEYYESNPELRGESNFGDERLESEIKVALQKIEILRNQN